MITYINRNANAMIRNALTLPPSVKKHFTKRASSATYSYTAVVKIIAYVLLILLSIDVPIFIRKSVKTINKKPDIPKYNSSIFLSFVKLVFVKNFCIAKMRRRICHALHDAHFALRILMLS